MPTPIEKKERSPDKFKYLPWCKVIVFTDKRYGMAEAMAVAVFMGCCSRSVVLKKKGRHRQPFFFCTNQTGLIV